MPSWEIDGFPFLWLVWVLPDFRLPDKALDLFLQIFDAGTLTDAQGRKCDFREAVIILTSNLGSGVEKKRRMGFGADDEAFPEDAHAPWEEAIRKHMRPELVNRLTKIVHFNPLGIPLADALLNGEVRDGRVIRVGVRDGGILLDFGCG